MPPPLVINGAAARATAINEYTLTSWAIRNPSRVVFRNSPFISSAGANATLCTNPSSTPYRAFNCSNSFAVSTSDGFMCDVTSDVETAKLFEQLKARYGVLDGLVHSVAFAPADDMKGEFLNTTREGFRIAHDVSVYSLIALARAAAPLMTNGGGMVTLTYYGAEKVVPKYNVMGVAKAALEATVRYLASDL